MWMWHLRSRFASIQPQEAAKQSCGHIGAVCSCKSGNTRNHKHIKRCPASSPTYRNDLLKVRIKNTCKIWKPHVKLIQTSSLTDIWKCLWDVFWPPGFNFINILSGFFLFPFWLLYEFSNLHSALTVQINWKTWIEIMEYLSFSLKMKRAWREWCQRC